MNRILKRIVLMIICSFTIGLSVSMTVMASAGDDLARIAEGEMVGSERGWWGTDSRKWIGRPNKYNKNSNADWCAYFVLWCAKQAGISTDIIPYNEQSSAGCSYLYNRLRELGAEKVDIPKAGDLVFYDYMDGDTPMNHVGIMIDSTTTIQGNVSDYLWKTSNVLYYDHYNDSELNDGKYIVRYLRPKYVSPAPSPQPKPQPPKTVAATKLALKKTTLNVSYNSKPVKLELKTVKPANATLSWSSDNPAIASVDNAGVVTPHKEGKATITVTGTNKKINAKCKVTVKGPVAVKNIKLSKTSLKINAGKEQKVTVTISPKNAETGKKISWSSNNTKVADVRGTGNSIYIVGKAGGSATITAKSSNGKSATCKVTVKGPVAVKSVKLPSSATIKKPGGTVKLKATISPSNAANKGISWSSDNPSIATVKDGVVTGKKGGTTYIRVTTKDGNKSAKCKVTVKGPIYVTSVKLSKTTLSLKSKKTATLKATVSPSNATNKKVTWSSSNSKVASVSSNGKVTAKSTGSAVITVKTADGGKTAKCTVSVNGGGSKENTSAKAFSENDEEIKEADSVSEDVLKKIYGKWDRRYVILRGIYGKELYFTPESVESTFWKIDLETKEMKQLYIGQRVTVCKHYGYYFLMHDGSGAGISYLGVWNAKDGTFKKIAQRPHGYVGNNDFVYCVETNRGDVLAGEPINISVKKYDVKTGEIYLLVSSLDCKNVKRITSKYIEYTDLRGNVKQLFFYR